MSSPTTQLQRFYWSSLVSYLDENDLDLRRPRVQSAGWVPISLGRSGFKICLKVNTVAQNIAVELYIDHQDAQLMFNKLKLDQATIEQETGLTLDWQELPNRHACRIEFVRDNSSLSEQSLWPEYIKWHIEVATKFYQAFERRVLAL
ncbi:DUF4268 domain-containing protein [Polynucleobacter sphagniphilus]|jgi:hypothetical protein|uniref:DUF4268 domain-containing protein n=1 Tax=Polynucleobacter sphagniphilus TaxID=1743169 RepID=A0AA43S7G1_9BURK|nr:DUF4268 domain-containing protein [Polynucleobacter sphagniphilus]MDH6504806.1 hypothetical protein [Polynucleobacter sphagniphilus]MDH6512924.1 hypothetical protein [Polynucleobacter sphagniphilus]